MDKAGEFAASVIVPIQPVKSALLTSTAVRCELEMPAVIGTQ